MSLLSEAMETFSFMDKAHVSDGEGGYIVNWVQGADFDAAIRLDNSIQAKRAQAEGVRDLYTIITDKSVSLQNNDVVYRKATAEYYRITANSRDNRTPESAGLNMRAVSAERWELPND
jgi:head-tail adaptor